MLGLNYEDPVLMLSAFNPKRIPSSTLSAYSALSHNFRKPLKQILNIQKTAVLLLLAGETEVNPGPRPIKYPCLLCNKAVIWGHICLQCDQRSGWYHVEYTDMPSDILEIHANTSVTWICCKCGLPNISPPIFHSLSGLSLSNPFDSLGNTTQSEDQSEEIGSPIATSSPTAKPGNKI